MNYKIVINNSNKVGNSFYWMLTSNSNVNNKRNWIANPRFQKILGMNTGKIKKSAIKELKISKSILVGNSNYWWSKEKMGFITISI